VDGSDFGKYIQKLNSFDNRYIVYYKMNVIGLFILLFVFQPLLEYGVHRVVHIYHIQYHHDHHRIWSATLYKKYNGDAHVRYFIIILFIMRYYIPAIALLKYEVTHTLAHIYPNNYLYRHHFWHHQYSNKNFAFSAVWPDKLFGTFIK